MKGVRGERGGGEGDGAGRCRGTGSPRPRRRKDGRVDADQATRRVEQGAATVARVDRSVRLNPAGDGHLISPPVVVPVPETKENEPT